VVRPRWTVLLKTGSACEKRGVVLCVCVCVVKAGVVENVAPPPPSDLCLKENDCKTFFFTQALESNSTMAFNSFKVQLSRQRQGTSLHT
jgi:hypothetical protein